MKIILLIILTLLLITIFVLYKKNIKLVKSNDNLKKVNEGLENSLTEAQGKSSSHKFQRMARPVDLSEKPEVLIGYRKVVDYFGTDKSSSSDQANQTLGRISTFDDKEVPFCTVEINQFTKYLNYVTDLGKKTNYLLSGLSFIYVKDVDKNGRTNMALVYIPTTKLENGNHVQFDPVLTNKEGRLITFQEALSRKGFPWKYGENDSVFNPFVFNKDGSSANDDPLQKMAKRGPHEELGGAGNWTGVPENGNI